MASIARPIARSIADAIARYDGGSSIGGGGSPTPPDNVVTIDGEPVTIDGEYVINEG